MHKLALSGTPIENKLEELWSVFDFLMPGFLFSMGDFNSHYVNPIMERHDKVVEKRLKLQIYPFILRRMKRDVAKDLPDKVENVAYCEMTDEQKAKSAEEAHKWFAEVGSWLKDMTDNAGDWLKYLSPTSEASYAYEYQREARKEAEEKTKQTWITMGALLIGLVFICFLIYRITGRH